MSGLRLPPWDRLDRSLDGHPYSNDAEFLSDYLAWLDFLLEAAISLEKSNVYLPGIAVPPHQLALALQDSCRSPQDRECPVEISHALRVGQTYLLNRALASVDADVTLSFVHLFTIYALNPLERLAVLLSFAPLEHHKYADCYAMMQGSPTQCWPTDLLVRSLYRLYATEVESQTAALCDPSSPLRRTLFQPNFDGVLRLSQRVFLWIHGSHTLDYELAPFCQWLHPTDASLLVNETQYATLRTHVKRGTPSLIQLCGRVGSGRRFLLRHLSAEFHFMILNIDLEALCACEEKDQALVLDRVALECKLTDCSLHLYHWPENEHHGIRKILSRIATLSSLLFLSVDHLRILSDCDLPPTIFLSLDELTIAQRAVLWASNESLSLSPSLIPILATRYRLTPGGIQRACAEAETLASARGIDTESLTVFDLQHCIYHGDTVRLEKFATRVHPSYSWEDLVLPSEQKAILTLVRDRLRLRKQVDEDWGFQKKYAYGRGLSLLFCGPPGTGKTMAAQVLAREIGMELFRVDMSLLTSKYIGESEKNISHIFDVARDSNAILFFDEADSLFAKRTEVQNSNDRYANAEVSFLLQKMEDYEGMCILTTNLIKNFDTAFFRRLTFVVRFQMPDATQRLDLWKAAFPTQAPLGNQLDLKHFADTLELNGSSIKAIAYNAACLAAAEGSEISKRHIVQALKLENIKTGQLFFPTEI